MRRCQFGKMVFQRCHCCYCCHCWRTLNAAIFAFLSSPLSNSVWIIFGLFGRRRRRRRLLWCCRRHFPSTLHIEAKEMMKQQNARDLTYTFGTGSPFIIMTQKWQQNDTKMTKKLNTKKTEMRPKRHQFIQKWHQNDTKMTLKWHQKDTKMTLKWHQKDTKKTLKCQWKETKMKS